MCNFTPSPMFKHDLIWTKVSRQPSHDAKWLHSDLMFLFRLVLNCEEYNCRCGEAASKDWQEVTVLTTKGTHLTISVSDTMCLNHSSLHRPSACKDSSTQCKRCGTNKSLETMQKHLSMAQSHLRKPGSIAAFKILLFFIKLFAGYFDKQRRSVIFKTLTEKKN